MENKQKHFITEVFDTISNKMKSNWNSINFNKYPVSMEITDGGMLITKVGDAEFKDACPMKGTKRNRTEIAKVVCQHICDEWGGTFDEVTEYTRSFMTEFYKLCGIEV